MNSMIDELPKEINKIIDFYIPYKKLISISIDDFLFHYLNIIGVYILYSNKVIIYVGCSINIGARLKAHYFSRIYGNKITDIDVIRFLPNESSMETEARLIEQFKPLYNKTNKYLYCNDLPLDFDIVGLIKEIKERLQK